MKRKMAASYKKLFKMLIDPRDEAREMKSEEMPQIMMC